MHTCMKQCVGCFDYTFRQRYVLSGRKKLFLRKFIEFVWYNGLVGGSFKVCGCEYLLGFCLGGYLGVSRICLVFICGLHVACEK